MGSCKQGTLAGSSNSSEPLDTQPRARIVGTGMFLPDIVMTNDDIAELCDTNDEWIKARTGISERHIAADGENTSDLATNAAQRHAVKRDFYPSVHVAVCFLVRQAISSRATTSHLPSRDRSSGSCQGS